MNHPWQRLRIGALGLVVCAGLVGASLGTGLAAMAQDAAGTPPSTLTYAPEFDPANFGTVVDHPYFPLAPGTSFMYEGMTDGEELREAIEVTSDTEEILGVTCVVVLAREFIEGELIEETLDWYAQDNDGNVWYMGEATQEMEDGEVVSTAGSWEAGVDGAEAGIIMPADPQVGDRYQQELYPGEAEDMAEVVRLGETVTINYGTFDDVIVTKEWNPLEPGVTEEKSYAPGIGLILAEAIEGEDERLELVEFSGLTVGTPAS